jgi:hypothetical protein
LVELPQPVCGGADEDHCPGAVRPAAHGERRILLVGHRCGDAVELVEPAGAGEDQLAVEGADARELLDGLRGGLGSEGDQPGDVEVTVLRGRLGQCVGPRYPVGGEPGQLVEGGQRAGRPAMMTPATSPGWPRRRSPLQHALVGRELKAQRRLTSARRKWHRSRRSGRGSGPAIVASALEEPVKTGLIRWCCGRSTIRRCGGFALGPASPPIRRLAYTMGLDAVGSLVSASAVRAF